MAATNRQVITPAADGSSWLVRRRGLVIAVAMVAAASALALGQGWLAVADLVPLLFLMPCAVMMFMMTGMNHGQQTDTSQNSTRNDAPTAPDTRN
jgi:hypothetical protein